ncbi:MAG: YitT family protein [Candidatus Faecivicinus sp.]
MQFAKSLKVYLLPGEQRRRLLMTIIGIFVCCASVAFLRQSGFGTDPFQCFCNGLNHIVPLDFGTMCMLLSAAMISVELFLNRHYIGIATVINLFLTGYMIEFWEKVIYGVMGDPTLALRIVYLIIGLVSMCFAASLYFTADLGVSVYDFIALHLADIQKKVPFRFCRIATDLICVLAGLAMGYVPGIGTLISALFTGPLISFFNRTVSEPLRRGRQAAH